MKNFKSLIATISETNLKASNGKINQVVRNTMKSQIVEALMLDLADFDPVRTADGVAIAVENKSNLVVFTLDPVIKALDFDIDGAGADYQDKVQERLDKEAERLAKKKAE